MSEKKTSETEKTEVKPAGNGLSNIASALSKAQAVMTGAKKDKLNPFFKSKYSDLSSVFDAIREPFAENNLSITQTMDILDSGIQVLRTRLMHSSGEYIDSKMLLPTEPNPQKMGSLITYLKRYSLMAICGIPSEDDDGNAASQKAPPPPKYINQKQLCELEELINGNTRVRALVLANCKGDLATITADRFQGAVNWITSEIEKDGGKHA